VPRRAGAAGPPASARPSDAEIGGKRSTPRENRCSRHPVYAPKRPSPAASGARAPKRAQRKTTSPRQQRESKERKNQKLTASTAWWEARAAGRARAVDHDTHKLHAKGCKGTGPTALGAQEAQKTTAKIACQSTCVVENCLGARSGGACARACVQGGGAARSRLRRPALLCCPHSLPRPRSHSRSRAIFLFLSLSPMAPSCESSTQSSAVEELEF
jgi:hypothetical protein